MIKKQSIDGAQERWHATLAELSALPVQTPEIQRDVDADRVNAIVSYQMDRLHCTGSMLFLGDIAILLNDKGQLWIVDGQHRLRAARHLVSTRPDHPVSVLVISSESLTLQQAFKLVNTAVPVPEWLVEGTIQARQRCMLRSVEAALRKRFGSFLSSATTPRRPNVSLSALVSALATASCRHRDAFPSEPPGVIAYLMWCNNRLRSMHETSTLVVSAIDKATRNNSEPLFFSVDPTFEFISEWVSEWPSLEDSRQENTAPLTAPRDRRVAIPKATRVALWNNTFGERRGVGACFCCKQEVTQQSFECGHVLAVARGGTDAIDNLRPLCKTCNRSMGTEDMPAFMERTGLNRAARSPVAFDPFSRY